MHNIMLITIHKHTYIQKIVILCMSYNRKTALAFIFQVYIANLSKQIFGESNIINCRNMRSEYHWFFF